MINLTHLSFNLEFGSENKSKSQIWEEFKNTSNLISVAQVSDQIKPQLSDLSDSYLFKTIEIWQHPV